MLKFLFIFVFLSILLQIFSFPFMDADPEDLIDISHLGSAAFGKPDENTGEILDKWHPETNDSNAEEVGNYFEGDILIPKPLSRNGIGAESARWPGGKIPYEIKGYYSAKDMSMIQAAMNDYHTMTCIQFVPRTSNDKDYISITSGNTGCWSSVGRIGGRQELNLQSPGCTYKKGTIIHEFMHAVGFFHEQNRYERDNHVTIKWNNIIKGRENNFQKSKKEDTKNFDVPYDYRSVMHYSANAFSSNNQPTIVTKIRGVELGQREGFSRHDVLKIKRMYNCTN
ncbi:zinc metalloproteinase nas-4 [Chrysoperla carnea]|uniref:zinc metalloproteinase nas-4 n=1 Tax=Chrysoperla carnea TaxID=189513 RepID=UPI001D08B7B4|nr:zinc metalloproteinase nas-4 [Chrysoperla carnea]